MHGQRDHHGLRLGEADQSDVLSGFLTLDRMDAAVVAVEAALADLLDVLIDDLEVDLGVVTQLDGLGSQFAQTALSCQLLLDLLPGAVLVGADFALAVLGAAALAVEQALGAVNDGADAAGDVQVALSAGLASLLGQGHAVVTGVIQGITGGKDGHVSHFSHSLNTQTAGDDHDVLGTLGDQILHLLEGLSLVAQEINAGRACHILAVFSGKSLECIAIRFLESFKSLETLVASHHEQVVRSGQDLRQLIGCLQRILGIVFQLLTFLTIFSTGRSEGLTVCAPRRSSAGWP